MGLQPMVPRNSRRLGVAIIVSQHKDRRVNVPRVPDVLGLDGDGAAWVAVKARARADSDLRGPETAALVSGPQPGVPIPRSVGPLPVPLPVSALSITNSPDRHQG